MADQTLAERAGVAMDAIAYHLRQYDEPMGIREMLEQLESWLVEVFEAVELGAIQKWERDK